MSTSSLLFTVQRHNCAACRLKASLALSRLARLPAQAPRGGLPSRYMFTSNASRRMSVWAAGAVRRRGLRSASAGVAYGSRRLMFGTGGGSFGPVQSRARLETSGSRNLRTYVSDGNRAEGSGGVNQSDTQREDAEGFGQHMRSDTFAENEETEQMASGSALGELPLDEQTVNLLQKRNNGEWEEVEVNHSGGVEEETEYMTSAELNEDAQLLDELRAAQMGLALEQQDEAADLEDEQDHTHRTHPLTTVNRFGTSPSTIPLPQGNFIDPIASQLAGVSMTHLSQAAHRLFGGVGLPYSTSTPQLAKTMQQKPIALNAAQSRMSDMEADIFLGTLLPGLYASIMSALVETRKRLGAKWAEELVHKAARGELRILDAGGAGAGVIAVRDMLRAEWQRMHEQNSTSATNTAIASADGKIGGAPTAPPSGSATVLIGPDALRYRVSKLLDNTVFLPRLPDYVHTENAKQRGKFDLVIAPHSLWPLRENYLRKAHVENLWSLTYADGGVLVLLEKGVARGFEVIAGAREMLLDNHIASPEAESDTTRSSEPDLTEAQPGFEEANGNDTKLEKTKEIGSIIAPCTNHKSCPMYKPQGLVKGRRDICHFSQRYFRAPVQQRLLGARDKNFEDVKFSFLSVQRGRDAREGWQQDAAAVEAAFAGYAANDLMTKPDQYPSSLTLPRAILPPLKRRGHVILDLCTPAGTLERWTVPRSFNKQAFRDARKSSWGDLWALGAKTRVSRTPKIKKHGESDARDETSGSRNDVVSSDSSESQDLSAITSSLPAGRMRMHKVKGVRDKRDKKADGRGRRKARSED